MVPLEGDPASRARESAFRMLARREHSRAELRFKLSARGFADSLIDILLQDLQDERAQSDERFAESLLSSRLRSGYGPRRIRLELKDKGVASDLAERVVAGADTEWDQVLTMLYDRKFGCSSIKNFKEWARRAQYLQQRGFDTDAIRRIIGSWDRVGTDINENKAVEPETGV